MPIRLLRVLSLSRQLIMYANGIRLKVTATYMKNGKTIKQTYCPLITYLFMISNLTYFSLKNSAIGINGSYITFVGGIEDNQAP